MKVFIGYEDNSETSYYIGEATKSGYVPYIEKNDNGDEVVYIDVLSRKMYFRSVEAIMSNIKMNLLYDFEKQTITQWE